MTIIGKNFIRLKKQSQPPGAPSAGTVNLWVDAAGVLSATTSANLTTKINSSIQVVADFDNVDLESATEGDVVTYQSGQWVASAQLSQRTELGDLNNVTTTSPFGDLINRDCLVREGGEYLPLSSAHMPCVVSISQPNTTLSINQTSILKLGNASESASYRVWGDVDKLVSQESLSGDYFFSRFKGGAYVLELTLKINTDDVPPYFGEVKIIPSFNYDGGLANWSGLGIRGNTDVGDRYATMRLYQNTAGDTVSVRNYAHFPSFGDSGAETDNMEDATGIAWKIVNNTNVSVNILEVTQSFRKISHLLSYNRSL